MTDPIAFTKAELNGFEDFSIYAGYVTTEEEDEALAVLREDLKLIYSLICDKPTGCIIPSLLFAHRVLESSPMLAQVIARTSSTLVEKKPMRLLLHQSTSLANLAAKYYFVHEGRSLGINRDLSRLRDIDEEKLKLRVDDNREINDRWNTQYMGNVYPTLLLHVPGVARKALEDLKCAGSKLHKPPVLRYNLAPLPCPIVLPMMPVAVPAPLPVSPLPAPRRRALRTPPPPPSSSSSSSDSDPDQDLQRGRSVDTVVVRRNEIDTGPVEDTVEHAQEVEDAVAAQVEDTVPATVPGQEDEAAVGALAAVVVDDVVDAVPVRSHRSPSLDLPVILSQGIQGSPTSSGTEDYFTPPSTQAFVVVENDVGVAGGAAQYEQDDQGQRGRHEGDSHLDASFMSNDGGDDGRDRSGLKRARTVSTSDSDDASAPKKNTYYDAVASRSMEVQDEADILLMEQYEREESMQNEEGEESEEKEETMDDEETREHSPEY